MQSGSAGDIFILIHGTVLFKWLGLAAATWINSDSRFSEGLLKHIAGASVRPFSWPGWNLATSRDKAAVRLARVVRQTRTAHPDARLFLVGHSHGGNVALRALLKSGDDPETTIQHEIAGVVCLATPFFQLHGSRGALLPMAGAGALLLIALTVIPDVVNYLGNNQWLSFKNAQGLGTASQFAVILFVIFGVWLGVLGVGVNWATRLLAMPDLAKTAVLVIRSPGDEVSLGLAASQFINYVVNSIWRIATWIFRSAEPGTLILLIMLLVIVGALGPLLLREAGLLSQAADAALVRAWEGPIPMMFAFIPGLAAVVWLLSVITVFLQGYDLAFPAAGLDVSVESAPLGAARFHQLDATVPGLRHSASYSHPRTPAVIAEWLRIASIPPVGGAPPVLASTVLGLPDRSSFWRQFVNMFRRPVGWETRQTRRANDLAAAGRIDDAIATMKKTIEEIHLNGENGELFVQLARFYCAADDRVKAAAAVREAIAREPYLEARLRTDADLRDLVEPS